MKLSLAPICATRSPVFGLAALCLVIALSTAAGADKKAPKVDTSNVPRYEQPTKPTGTSKPTADQRVTALMNQAQAAFEKGDHDKAVSFLNQALSVDSKSIDARYARARLFEKQGQREKAVADYSEVLKLDPSTVNVYQFRGLQYFRLGRVKEAVADFDKYVELNPPAEPYHWQRGIAYYYAGQFDQGRKQFELHQTVNPNDVENAAWHFLCAARAAGVAKARAGLLPTGYDPRVPMKEIHDLLAGTAKPEDVLAAAKGGNALGSVLNRQMFNAQLYLGLYFEALGVEKQSREYLFKAEEQAKDNDYMGEVAHLHADLLRKGKRK